MKEQSATSMNVGSNHSSNSSNEDVQEELILRDRIENSPFEIITFEKKSFIALGQYRVSEETTDKASLIKSIKDKDWDLLFNMVSVIAKSVVDLDAKK